MDNLTRYINISSSE